MARAWGSQVRGIKTGRSVLSEEAARVEAGRIAGVYESHEFDVAAPTAFTSIRTIVNHSNPTLCSCGRASGPFSTTSGAFALLLRANRVIVRNVGQVGGSAGSVQVRCPADVGDSTNIDLITIDPGEYADWNLIEVQDILIACPLTATRLRVFMA